MATSLVRRSYEQSVGFWIGRTVKRSGVPTTLRACETPAPPAAAGLILFHFPHPSSATFRRPLPTSSFSFPVATRGTMLTKSIALVLGCCLPRATAFVPAAVGAATTAGESISAAVPGDVGVEGRGITAVAQTSKPPSREVLCKLACL